MFISCFVRPFFRVIPIMQRCEFDFFNEKNKPELEIYKGKKDILKHAFCLGRDPGFFLGQELVSFFS